LGVPISTVISFFAIIILTILGALYRSGHEELVGGINDPTDGKAVSGTVFTAVFVYIVRFAPDIIRIPDFRQSTRYNIRCNSKYLF
jgi:hypothetical protein